MEDLFGRLWDRHPERRSRPYYCNQSPSTSPYAASYAPEYYYHPQPVTQSVQRLKPRSFSVPVVDNRNRPDRPNGDYSASSRQKNVVSIPFNFVGSDVPSNEEKKAVVGRPRMDENTAAVKVQKVFRGFSVRKSAPLKNLRIIAKAKAEGEDIRKRISDERVVDLIRRDEKERLKITEWIMSLLLKLDAIQGVNSVVRESRKAATRELVNLQETVDAIIADKPMEEEVQEEDTEDEADVLDKTEETDALECLQVNSGEEINEEDGLGHPKEVEYMDDAELRDPKPCEMQAEESLPTQMHKLQLEGSNETEEFCTSQGTDDHAELEKVRCDVSVSDNGLIADMLETETVQDDKNMKEEDNSMEYEEAVDATGTGDTVLMGEAATEDIGMVREENKRLKTMVADLLKKSEKQSQMIDNLSSRIAQLEGQVLKKKKIADQRKKTKAVMNVASRICACDESENGTTTLTDAVMNVASRICACDESENGTTTLTDEEMPQPNERRRRRKMNK